MENKEKTECFGTQRLAVVLSLFLRVFLRVFYESSTKYSIQVYFEFSVEISEFSTSGNRIEAGHYELIYIVQVQNAQL